jgi:hypothetical protein
MSVDKYKFISPGIFLHEIDNTGLPAAPSADVGPALIGRAVKGPILKPTTITSYADFVDVFGSPVPGGEGGDISRDGNYTAPTYAAYAAQAWLRNNSTLVYVRLGGQANGSAADPDGLAGWQTATTTFSTAPGTNAGAYGLFVAPSHSAPATTPATGTLAAIWYLNQNLLIGLSGTAVSGTDEVCGTSISVQSVAGTQEFKVQLSGAGGIVLDTSFDFTPTSPSFIRKVFNTNPALTNTMVTDTTTDFWLGESFEGRVQEVLTDATAGSLGVILPLQNNTGTSMGGSFRKDFSDAETGWFFSQDMTTGDSTGSYQPSNMERLFKLVARNSGDWAARNLKVSIKDIKRSPNAFTEWGSFTVALRKMSDTDNRIEFVEQYNNCNLNPNSVNFIGRKIGDRHLSWDDENRSYRELGDYPNMSKYIRVTLTDNVRDGDIEPQLLPFGVRGPLRFVDFTDASITPLGVKSYVSGNFDDYGAPVTTFISGTTTGRIRYEWPVLRQRVSASEGDPVNPKDVYFGVDTTFNTSRFEASVLDHLKIKPTLIDDFAVGTVGGSETVVSTFFTLDDMCNTNTELTGTNVYLSGSRALAPGDREGLTYIRGTGPYTAVIETAGIDRFTTVFHGGSDGLNIRETEPFRNSLFEAVGGTTPTLNYAMNSIQVAIDSLRDPEVVSYNLASMPGIKNNTLNRSLINSCEQRGDALAVIDLQGDYISQYESTLPAIDRLPDVDAAILDLRNNLVVNSSYGCAYFPWVQIRDLTNGQFVWVPPSVAAIGAMSFSQRSSELWFAPAGFTRGGLSTGAAGLPVVSVRKRLTSKDRDKLYDASINPIAQFPAEGIVIFGQKTLQATQSALDRINVRRLLIFLKRSISRYAATILFDQNVRTTWNRFRGVVEPFLASVQSRLGITNFRLILDETTTTPDLIDRNIMYAKIYIKPARSIEYIAIDFILTDSGAAFED